MLEELSRELPSAILQTLLGSLLTLLALLAGKLYGRLRTWNIRKFWKPFMGKSLNLVITEYSPERNERFAKLARYWGDRWLISKGMAFSLSHLLYFCDKCVTSRQRIVVCGDKSGNHVTDNIIVLGSTAVNLFAKSMLERLEEIYDIPYQITWDKDGVKKEILISSTGQKLVPEYNSGFGCDYGLVIKALYQNSPQRWVLLIEGCHMWGTETATEAVTNLAILNEIARRVDGSQNVAFIVKTRLANSRPSAPELEINDTIFAQPLKAKNQSLVRKDT